MTGKYTGCLEHTDVICVSCFRSYNERQSALICICVYLYIFIAKAIKSLLPEKYMPYVMEVMGNKVEA